MEKIAQQAKVRKRRADQSQAGTLIAMVCVCLFAMVFVFAMVFRGEDKFRVVVLDNAGEIHSGQLVPFGDAQTYHAHLRNIAVSGIYARDENGPMNNYLETYGVPAVIKQRDEMFRESDRLFRDKRILQFPRIVGYAVDVVSNKRMEIRCRIQIVRNAFTLSGKEVQGIETKLVLLIFERNEDLSSTFYQPWKLTEFQEFEDNQS